MRPRIHNTRVEEIQLSFHYKQDPTISFCMENLAEVKKAISEKIKFRIKELCLEKQELAHLMHVQPSSVTKWLKGEHNFTMKTLFELERVLQISLIDLDTE